MRTVRACVCVCCVWNRLPSITSCELRRSVASKNRLFSRDSRYLLPPYIGWSDVTESIVTLRSPCCGYNLAWCVVLNCEDLWSCSHKTESVSLRICPHDHWLRPTTKAYLSALTVASIFRSFTYKMAAKTGWHRYGTKLRHCHPMYIILPGLTARYCPPYRERKCAVTVGTVLVHCTGHFQC